MDASDAIGLVFSGVVAASTVVYAVLTHKLVSETRNMRESQFRPLINISIIPREEEISWLDFVVQNASSNTAYDVQFELTGTLPDDPGPSLKDVGFIKNGIKHLGPNQRISLFLCSVLGLFETGSKRPIPNFSIVVKYKGATSEYVDTFSFDFKDLQGLSQLGIPPIHKISRSIEGIQKDFHKLSQSGQISVLTQPKQEKREETHELMRKGGKIPPASDNRDELTGTKGDDE